MIKEVRFSNFTEDVCEENLLKIENGNECFRLLKVKGAVQRFGNYDKGSPGKLLFDFMEYCLQHKGPVKILDNDAGLEIFKHQYIVQNLFPDRIHNYTSLISTSVLPSALTSVLGNQLHDIEDNLKAELYT